MLVKDIMTAPVVTAREALNRDQYGSTKAATVRRVGSYGQ